MADLEREYYESDSFWGGNMVQDEANQLRIQLTLNMLTNDIKSLIDVGCGNGVFIHKVQEHNPLIDITGVDRSNTALKYVKAAIVNSSLENIPLETKAYDCVTCLQVIEHLPVNIYEKGLDELARLSSKYIIVSVPNNEVLEDSYTKCPNCKSIFNREMHLRSFTKEKIEQLFQSRGFKCTKIVTTGRGESFLGYKQYQKVFYPEQLLKWKSPLCPVCGYSDETNLELISVPLNQKQPKRKLISYLSYLPKLIWPKVYSDYWAIAHFERI